MKSVRCELKSAKHFKFRGALARATPLGVPSREEKRPFHLSKRTSSFIYRGEMHFDSQKMGKLQRISRCLGFVCGNSQYGVTHRYYVIL